MTRTSTFMLCPECGQPMVFADTSVRRPWPHWACPQPRCSGHQRALDDGTPLGVPARAEDRLLRIKAHQLLDATCRRLGWSQGDAYRYLQTRLRLSREDCHIGRFHQPELEAAMNALNEARTGKGPEVTPLTLKVRALLAEDPNMGRQEVLRRCKENGFAHETEKRVYGVWYRKTAEARGVLGKRRAAKAGAAQSNDAVDLDYLIQVKRLAAQFGGATKMRELLVVVEAAGSIENLRKALDFLQELSK